MNTPLMELIAKLESYFNSEDCPQDDLCGVKRSIGFATELLEKEKEVIMDAYWDGGQDMPTLACTVEDYYTKTFTNESK